LISLPCPSCHPLFNIFKSPSELFSYTKSFEEGSKGTQFSFTKLINSSSFDHIGLKLKGVLGDWDHRGQVQVLLESDLNMTQINPRHVPHHLMKN
jgi:hypothetical protein